MNNLNLTFNIKGTRGVFLKTYYSITAISEAPDSKECIIHSNGQQDICLIPFEELHTKLTRIQNESTSR